MGGAALLTASALSSSLCGRAGPRQRRAALARSATVSVAVQNKGGEFFHPIGNVSGTATSSSPSFPGNTSPSFGASSGRSAIR